ncbi:MAG: putative iron-sulfur cluster assembly accessory protein [Candidatus Peribacteria bacterium]|nr:putative iron-sulfur cluster assembly accessory protein [Candidatus Peribacteria bacterium]
MPVSSATGPITKHMRVLDIITLCPEAENIMAEYGLHCFHCDANAFESLGDGCVSHGFSNEEVDELVDDINQIIRDLPEKSNTLTITAAAAAAIRDIAIAENRLGEGLAVIADGRGGFCLEFQPEPATDDLTFTNTDVPDMRFFAGSLTLKRIGGSTIDFRDGKCKLDLADAPNSGCGCKSGGTCGCKID